MHSVKVLNRSSVVTDDEVHGTTEALQQAMHEHFRSAWGVNTQIGFVGKNDQESWRGHPNLVVLDTSDEANALGYHDFTPEGLPLGKAFAKTDQQYGAKVSVTIAHELWEMIVDPQINLCVEDDARRVFVAYESADAVEADELAIDVNGFAISSFVFPSYFSRTAKGPFDLGGVLSAAFQLAEGGYESYWTSNGGWQQNVKRESGPAASDRPKVGSRRERRRSAYHELQRSID